MIGLESLLLIIQTDFQRLHAKWDDNTIDDYKRQATEVMDPIKAAVPMKVNTTKPDDVSKVLMKMCLIFTHTCTKFLLIAVDLVDLRVIFA